MSGALATLKRSVVAASLALVFAASAIAQDVNGTNGASSSSGTVSSISNSDGTLTLSPNPITGTGTASLNLGHANTWAAAQTFPSGDLISTSPSFAGTPTQQATAKSWGAAFAAYQLGNAGAIFGTTSDNSIRLGNNIYFNGTSNIYMNTDFASELQMGSGQLLYFTAPSGTGGNTASFTQVFSIGNTGTITLATAGYASCSAFVTNASGVLSGTCTSAIRFKDPIGRLPDDSVAAMNVRADLWKYKPQYQHRPSFDTAEHVSLIADDVARMDPHCGIYGQDGLIRNYEDRCVMAHLWNLWQRDHAELKRLAARGDCKHVWINGIACW